jgi:hypothetical protein
MEEFEYTTEVGGIFQLRAMIYDRYTLMFARKSDDLNSRSSSADSPLLKRGDPDSFGVVDSNTQIYLRNAAVKLLGSTEYNRDGALPRAKDPMGIFTGYNKCNAFVADMCYRTGQYVRQPRAGVYLGSPPSANNWAGMPETGPNGDPNAPYPIPKWQLLEDDTKPQPGFVAASGSVAASSGHTGIVDYDGRWISAGPHTVNRKADFSIFIRVYGVSDYKPAGQRAYFP